MEEIEVKFFIESKASFREKLFSVGAQKISDEFLMSRKIYEKPGAPEGDWFRVRREHDKVTLTFKSKKSYAIDGMHECEIAISDFDKGVYILEQAGLEFVTYQENYRETWTLDGAEIVIDTWPWLSPYIEIEGATKDVVITTAEKLGFSMDNAYYGTALELFKVVYKVSNKEFNTIREIKFNDPIPEILKNNKR